MRTRSVSPPRLRRGIIRSVWLLNPTTPSAGAGAAAQLPTQCLLFCIASSHFALAEIVPPLCLRRQSPFARTLSVVADPHETRGLSYSALPQRSLSPPAGRGTG